MSGFIPLSVPSIQGNEWKYVKECLDTEWVSSVGSYVDLFEKKICEYTGASFAVACVNGTAALQVGLRLAGVVRGDLVIVPTVTFIAPVNVVRYLGADPVFIDCDDYYNIDVVKTIDYIENHTELRNGYSFDIDSGARVAAIVPVHIFGNAVDLEKLVPVCEERNIAIVEDASESLGSEYTSGKYAGKHTGTIGRIGGYSFNGNKIITTGAGGMIVTSDEQLATQAKYLTTQAKDDAVRYVHDDVGYNFRMSNVQAAIGVAQMEKLPEYIDIKTNNFLEYKKRIEKIEGLKIAGSPPYARSNHWLYCLRIDSSAYGKDREQLMAFLSESGVQTRPVWYLNHLQRPYVGCRSHLIELAPTLLETTLTIPCSVNLSAEDLDRVVDLLESGKE